MVDEKCESVGRGAPVRGWCRIGARSDFHRLSTGAGPSVAQAPVGRRWKSRAFGLTMPPPRIGRRSGSRTAHASGGRAIPPGAASSNASSAATVGACVAAQSIVFCTIATPRVSSSFIIESQHFAPSLCSTYRPGTSFAPPSAGSDRHAMAHPNAQLPSVCAGLVPPFTAPALSEPRALEPAGRAQHSRRSASHRARIRRACAVRGTPRVDHRGSDAPAPGP